MNILRAFNSNLRIYLIIFAVSTVFATPTWGFSILVALGIISLSIYRATNKGKTTDNIQLEGRSKKDLILMLNTANQLLAQSRADTASLQRRLDAFKGVEQDDELKDVVLKLVASQLTAYDKFKGKISAEDTLEFLRSALVQLGKEFQEDQTRDWSEGEWNNTYHTMKDFNYARKGR